MRVEERVKGWFRVRVRYFLCLRVKLSAERRMRMCLRVTLGLMAPRASTSLLLASHSACVSSSAWTAALG